MFFTWAINWQHSCDSYLSLSITRVSEVIMFSPCVFVYLFVSLSQCLSGPFNYEGLVPHKQYFAGTLLGMSSVFFYLKSQLTTLMYVTAFIVHLNNQLTTLILHHSNVFHLNRQLTTLVWHHCNVFHLNNQLPTPVWHHCNVFHL